jgi:hypothetical protein
MSDYIDFGVLGRVLLFSLVSGVAITGAFAVGARCLAYADGARSSARPTRLAVSAAVACFVLAAAAVVVGIWFVLDKR